MKKLLAVASSFALAFAAPVALPTVVYAQGSSEVAEVCKLYVELGFYSAPGECLRDNGVSPVRLCQFLKDEGLFPFEFDDGPVANQGECVRWFRGPIQD